MKINNLDLEIVDKPPTFCLKLFNYLITNIDLMSNKW